MELTSDQKQTLDKLLSGANVFLTGDAGTGKSFVTKLFIAECKKAGKNILTMAPTGVAALELENATTLHRALGLKPSVIDPDMPAGAPPMTFMAADVIVIDEISMCRIDLFEKAMKTIRAAMKVKGRKQVVCVGDPFQLPPVITDRERRALFVKYHTRDGWFFESALWRQFNFTLCELREVVRQRGDKELTVNLRRAREGDEACIPFFNSHALKSKRDAPTDAIWLCPTKLSAEKVNTKRLEELKGKPKTYKARISGEVSRNDMPTEPTLTLNTGARVMAVANDPDAEYANGSLGTVISIGPDPEEQVTVAFDSGVVARIERKKWDIIKSDVVEDEEEHKPRIVSKVIGRFEQIPLKLAWAVTIHKSQGRTFERVNVDTRVFEKGMLYVALSRATNFEHLHIYPEITPSRLKADPAALGFYRMLLEKEDAPAQVDYEILESGTTVPDGMCAVAFPHEATEKVLQVLREADLMSK